MEGDPELPCHGLERRVVAHDHPDVAVELPGAMPDQQVVQAVVLARHEHREPPDAGAVTHRQRHLEPARQPRERGIEGLQPFRADLELDALEEAPGAMVVVLVGLEDVGAVLEQRAGDARHEPGPVGGADTQGQDMDVGCPVAAGGRVFHRRPAA